MRGLYLALGLISCLASPQVMAQVPVVAEAEVATTPLSQALSGEARVAYEDAKLLLQNGDSAGAGAKFQRAYTLSGDARLLWNIAACEKALRHYASASDFVQRYLAQGGAMLSDDNRQGAEATQRALRALFSEVTLSGLPDGARVTIDGVSLAVVPLAEPLRVDLGKHQLRVELDGYEPLTRSLDVPGGTQLQLELSLVPKSRLATLAVLASEPGALIALDGKVVGGPRFQGSVAAGPHRVRVTARDKKPYELSLELAAGSSRTLQIALQDERRPVWPWVAGIVGASFAASVGLYFLIKPEPSHVPAPQGELGNVQLPLTRSSR